MSLHGILRSLCLSVILRSGNDLHYPISCCIGPQSKITKIDVKVEMKLFIDIMNAY